jgi:hypothetical protein
LVSKHFKDYLVPQKYYAKVVENLKRRGRAKPGTVAKLNSTIVALIPGLSPDEVDTLVKQLQSHRVVSISKSKVSWMQEAPN